MTREEKRATQDAILRLMATTRFLRREVGAESEWDAVADNAERAGFALLRSMDEEAFDRERSPEDYCDRMYLELGIAGQKVDTSDYADRPILGDEGRANGADDSEESRRRADLLRASAALLEQLPSIELTLAAAPIELRAFAMDSGLLADAVIAYLEGRP